MKRSSLTTAWSRPDRPRTRQAGSRRTAPTSRPSPAPPSSPADDGTDCHRSRQRAEQEPGCGRKRMRAGGRRCDHSAPAYQAACDRRFLLVEPKTTTFVTCSTSRRASSSSTAASWAAVPPGAGSASSATASELEILERPGFPPNPPVDHVDFEEHAVLVAEAVGDGAHLVGHSYGGVITLLAAAAVPDAIHSLTVIEPPAMRRRPGQPRRRRVHPGWDRVVADRPDRRSGGVPARLPHLRRLRLRTPLSAAAAARAGSADADRRAQPVGGGDRPRRPRRGRVPEARRHGRPPRRLRRRLRRARRAARRGAPRAAGLRAHGAAASASSTSALAEFVARAETQSEQAEASPRSPAPTRCGAPRPPARRRGGEPAGCRA